MKNKIKYTPPVLIIGIIGLILVLYNLITFITYKPTVITRTKTIKCIVPKIIYKTKHVKQGVILDITYQTLAKDLINNYKFLSQNQQVQILEAIKKASKDYNINPLVIYSLIATESSFRFWIQSPRRLVVGSDGKKHRDKAIGMCSIEWSIWGKQLKEAKILSTKSELYEIQSNIIAGSYILKTLRDRYKGNMIKALEAYFGKCDYAKIYQRKIRAKIGSLVEREIL